MTKSLAEFKRFLNRSAPTLSDDEKKLANLILGGFKEIAVVGTAGGRRGKVLAKLIVEKGATASPELEITAEVSNANESEIVRLTKLEVEIFVGSQIDKFSNLKTHTPSSTGLTGQANQVSVRHSSTDC